MTVSITKFDRDNLDPVLDDVMKELRKVGEKYGLDFGRKGCRYTAGDFRMTITAKVVNRDMEAGVLTKAEQDYNRNRVIEGLPELGFTYYSNGIELTVVGWNSRARKYPVSLKGSDGKGYKASVFTVRGHMTGE